MQAKVDIDERQVYDYLTSTNEGRNLLEDLCLDLLNGHILDTNMYRLREWMDDNVADEDAIRDEAYEVGYDNGYEQGWSDGRDDMEMEHDCE